jgi:hypothetical protein
MTTVILLTTHPGGLDYDLDKNSNNLSKRKQSFDEHSWPSKFVWKNRDSPKARPSYCEHFALKLVQQWVQIGWKSRLQ